jgi:hypothetical protein
MRSAMDSSPVGTSLREPIGLIRLLMVSAMLITSVATASADEDAPHSQDSQKLKQDPAKLGQGSAKLGQGSAKLAQDAAKLERERAKAMLDSAKLKRQILASLDNPELELESADEKDSDSGFRFSKKGPIQYGQTFQIGDDEISIKLYGPVVKKNLGLKFKVEGLSVGDHPVAVEGFGNTKKGGLRFTVEF